VGRPGHESRTELTWKARSGSLAYEVVGVGHNYLESGSRGRLPGRVLHALRGSIRIANHAALFAGIRNLGNEETFDLSGFPLPGRTFFLTLSVGGTDASH
jgi:outer membrane receptor protein involved in Fe transport